MRHPVELDDEYVGKLLVYYGNYPTEEIQRAYGELWEKVYTHTPTYSTVQLRLIELRLAVMWSIVTDRQRT